MDTLHIGEQCVSH